MTKKAFCVGINDYPFDGNDLNGCINDANAWAELLADHYDFTRSDIKIITDAEATKANIVNGLKDLLVKAAPGDVLVFTNSSHGTYIADKNGDEPMYDEAMCPYDVQYNLLVDDDLRELFDQLPKEVSLTVISDSCFSGTVTRAAVSSNFPGMQTPDDRRVRFLTPALRGDTVLENPWSAKPKGHEKYPASKMNHLLLSGATDKEYSYDALIDGKYHGAMSYFALEAIRLSNYTLTYEQLSSRLSYLINQANYPQHPQLEGKGSNKKKALFT